MANVKLHLDNEGDGSFKVYEDKEEVGEMVVSVGRGRLTAHHTEVYPGYEGRGHGQQLLNAMVTYARENHLHVVANCPFVHAQFKRHPKDYADIWSGD